MEAIGYDGERYRLPVKGYPKQIKDRRKYLERWERFYLEEKIIIKEELELTDNDLQHFQNKIERLEQDIKTQGKSINELTRRLNELQLYKDVVITTENHKVFLEWQFIRILKMIQDYKNEKHKLVIC